MRKVEPVQLTCHKCGVVFTRAKWQHNNNIRRGRVKTFCSTVCASKIHRKPAVIKTESERITAARKGFTEACPVCNQNFLKVITTRITKQNYRRRSKHCQNCDYRVITLEVPEDVFEQGCIAPQTNTTQPKQTIACLQCDHNNRKQDRCDWFLPEYMTNEAADCNHYGSST